MEATFIEKLIQRVEKEGLDSLAWSQLKANVSRIHEYPKIIVTLETLMLYTGHPTPAILIKKEGLKAASVLKGKDEIIEEFFAMLAKLKPASGVVVFLPVESADCL